MSSSPAPESPDRRNWFARHKILTGLGAALILIVVIASFAGEGSGGDGSDPGAPVAQSSTPAEGEDSGEAVDEPAAPEAPAEPGIGVPVAVGDLEFTILGVAEVGATVGTEFLGQAAQGRYVGVDLRVANTGSEAATFFVDYVQIVDSADRTFDSDSTATLYAAPDSNVFLTEINPGNAFEGRVVFDLPVDASPSALIVTDNAFAGGERIRLQ